LKPSCGRFSVTRSQRGNGSESRSSTGSLVVKPRGTVPCASRITADSGSPFRMKSACDANSSGSFEAAMPMKPTVTPRARIRSAHAVSLR